MPAEAPPDQQLRSPNRPKVDTSAIEALFNDPPAENEPPVPEPAPEPTPEPSVAEQIPNPVESESEPPTTEAHVDSDPDDGELTPPTSDNALGSLLQNYGFQDVDEESAISRLDAYMQQVQQDREARAQLERELEEQRRLNAAIRAQYEVNAGGARQPEAATPAPANTPWWNPPKINEQTVQKYRVRNPETGEAGWAPNTPDEVRRQAEEYELYHEEWMNKLIYDPASIFDDLKQRIISEIQPSIQQTYEQQSAEQRREAELGAMANENDWLWAVDPVTNMPTQGYSQAGQAVEAEARELINSGLDELKAYQIAIQLHRPTPVESQQQVQQQARNTAAQQAEQRREALLRRSRPTPDRGGSIQTPPEEETTPRDPKMSYGQTLHSLLASN